MRKFVVVHGPDVDVRTMKRTDVPRGDIFIVDAEAVTTEDLRTGKVKKPYLKLWSIESVEEND